MQLRKIFAVALFCAAGLWAAERVQAFRAQLESPQGPVDGVVVTTGDQLLFINPDRPDWSFSIPRDEVRALTLRNDGNFTAQLNQPFAGPFGTVSNLNIRMMNPLDTNSVVQWAGLPTTTTLTPQTDTQELGAQQGNVSFDVRRGDDNGRLVVTPSGIDFVDISNRTHSRHWNYSELKGVERRNNNEIVVKPYQGDEYKFKTSTMMDQAIYNTIADRIVAARPR